MEFLGIGPLEFVIVILLVLIVFSPKDLAKGGRMLGRWINQLNQSDTWKSVRRVSQEMQDLPNRLAREAQLEELDDLKQGISLDESDSAASRSPAPRMPPAGKDSGERKGTPEAGAAGGAYLKGSRPDRTEPAASARKKAPKASAKSPSIPVAVESGKPEKSKRGRAAGKGSRKTKRSPSARPARKVSKKKVRKTPARSKRKTRAKKKT
jgi:Sec-independent protein translocase protein TatA